MVKRTIASLSVAAVLVVFSAGAASADTVISGPINLGTAANYGALAGSTVTNTLAGSTTLTGLAGVHPGSSITGFPPGVAAGFEAATPTALQAQSDLTAAYGVAASLTPTSGGLGDLTALDPVPGVYQGTNLSLTGDLTLNGDSTAVWVFQTDFDLIIASGARVILTGGASACNVFWKVGSSATIGSSAQMVGTVMADQSIFANSGATVAGRLLARIAAVTLDDNDITVPTGCASSGVVSSSPVITSGTPTAASRGVAYSFVVASTSVPAASYSIDSGALPLGLTLNPTTGEISGTPTATSGSSFTLRASNGIAADTLVTYALALSPAALAATGVDSGLLVAAAAALLLVGALLLRRRSLGAR